MSMYPEFEKYSPKVDNHLFTHTTISSGSLEIKDFSPGKWEEDEVPEIKPLSFGQKAASYAGRGLPDNVDMDVCRIKSSIAELIDIVDLRIPQSRAVTEDGFLERMAKDDATKKLIDACEAAVKYIQMSK